MTKEHSLIFLWSISATISLILLLGLVFMWGYMDQSPQRILQLTTQNEVDKYINIQWKERHSQEASKTPLLKIPTGIFLQSLKFNNTSEVNVTGYIWQRYSAELRKQLPHYHHERGFLKNHIGFILPEQVNTGNDIEPKETYRIQQNNDELLIGWYFEATLRQKFDYFTYPFDHKTVWIRLWPKDFAENIILTPDLGAYRATGLNNIFGIDQQIVLATWQLETTYFDYAPTCYDTNFGIDGYVGQEGFPELYYNIVIKRNTANAFIIHLLPLFIVATLLFSSLLSVTAKPEWVSIFGFSASGVLASCSALFFVIMLAHVQLREQFAGSEVVYMEYFYFLMYGTLLFVAINTFMFSMQSTSQLKWVQYRDNLIPKLLYWPMILFGMFCITLFVVLHINDDIDISKNEPACAIKFHQPIK